MRAALYAGAGTSLPPIPTRDQICLVRERFQGLTINFPTMGPLPWWETLAWFSNPADRHAAYDAKHAIGDTHIILDLTGAYREPGQPYANMGRDYSQNLGALLALAYEALDNGFLIDLRLGGDGQGAGPGYNDPVGDTYGHDWLMANFPRIAQTFAPIWQYIVFVPGYDGVFYGWNPDQVVAFGKLFRSIFPDGYLGIEFNTGHIPLGEGGGDYLPGGRMQDYDILFCEFDPFNYHSDSTWQILGRLMRPYHRPFDQPAGDDPTPPFYLAGSTPRGPWAVNPFEILTYRWVRGQVPLDELIAYRQYYTDMGCPLVN